MKTNILYSFFFLAIFSACMEQSPKAQEKKIQSPEKTAPLPAAYSTFEYLGILKNKKTGLVVNHTSTIGNVHLVDTLVASGVPVVKVFAPEHGFRGNADAGEQVKDQKDKATGLPILSLYGKNKKPSIEMLQGLDIVVFDIQDVGARFYTYISTMHYVMEACAEQNIPVLILDRPNPNGNYFDGPVLKKELQSFVGMHPIPIVHGLTVGELAKMINGEGWLKNNVHCDLKVVKASNYSHQDQYELPIKPSPNLPTQNSVVLYPSLCLFEGTDLSIGRGTSFPFEVIGHPGFTESEFSFTPKSIEGMSKYPKHENKKCFGEDLRSFSGPRAFHLSYLIQYYKQYADKTAFFNNFFDKLAGTDELRAMIQDGKTEKEIRDSWTAELADYRLLRNKYLLYPE